ncbi:DUF4116 domain-containing protein [Salinisphaera sp. G21_0]|nr:DUF4116 domain-containing protein [Salinisphaera sp. G21_0]
MALVYASLELPANKELVNIALQNNGKALLLGWTLSLSLHFHWGSIFNLSKRGVGA